jgi:hypothetical protein
MCQLYIQDPAARVLRVGPRPPRDAMLFWMAGSRVRVGALLEGLSRARSTPIHRAWRMLLAASTPHALWSLNPRFLSQKAPMTWREIFARPYHFDCR